MAKPRTRRVIEKRRARATESILQARASGRNILADHFAQMDAVDAKKAPFREKRERTKAVVRRALGR